MICPDKQLDMWEYCDNSVILANADWYYTKQQTEELIDSVSGMNPTEVQDMINRSIHSKADKTYVDEQDASLSNDIRAINAQLTQIYKKSDVNNLLDRKQNVLIAGSGITISGDVISSTGGGGDVTSGQVQSMIDHSISGKVDTSTFNTYSASTNVAINNKQDTLIAGDNITIVNNVISSTASGDVTSAQVETMIATSISGKADTTAVTQDIATATADMATKTWVGEQGYLTEHQSLSAYSTTVEMDNAIDAAVSGKADSTAVTQDIAAATDDMATRTWVGEQGYITGVDLSNYATLQDIPTSNSALTNDAGYITSAALNGYATEDYVTAATDDMATQTWVQNQGYLTEHQSLSAYSTTQEMNEAISASTSGKVDTSTYTAYTAATDTALQGKQDTLISGTNIKTINNVSILGSGNVDIQGGGNPTVEVTQAEYDALVSAGTVSADTFYIITDAAAGDLSNYYTKSETSGATEISTALNAKADTATTYTKTEVDNAITAATSTKQDTLVSGTNIKTINNESILGSGNIDIQGGGGKAVSAGTNISITTGETADTINCTLPIVMKYSNMRINSNREFANSLSNCFTFGGFNTVGNGNSCGYLVTFGSDNDMSASSNKRRYRYAFGTFLKTQNSCEIAFSKYNVSSSASETFGDSGNTLFSVGNGTADNARHNAFEIRQNGDIYCSDGTNDVKLQDTITATAANTTALGGLKLVKLTQSEYDALSTKDSNTLYVIV